ncbi:hypothetical protein SB772_24530 [Paraburkholderia sp. SIMBA_030]
MSLGANVRYIRGHQGWSLNEFVYRFAPLDISSRERRRYYDSLYSLEGRNQRTSWMLARMEPVLRVSAEMQQSGDLTRCALACLTGDYGRGTTGRRWTR